MSDSIDKVYQKWEKIIDDYYSDPYIGYSSLQDSVEDCVASSQTEVLARLLNRENLFISGKAGVGKSFLIDRFVKLIEATYEGQFNIAITASTALAASLINGTTIHSWSGLGIYKEQFNPYDKNGPKVFYVKNRIKYTDVLIIDEISMLPAYYLDNLDSLCRYIRRNDEPFGGIQVVFLGDFLQLPPVKEKDPIPGMNYGLAITSQAWQKAQLKYCYLDKIFRTKNDDLIYLLKKIENNKVDGKARKIIDGCKNNPIDPNKVYTHLYTTNKNVDKYNVEELAKNPHNEEHFVMKVDYGLPDDIKRLQKDNRIPSDIVLKKDATVIVTANIKNPNSDDFDVINGTVAKVESMTQNNIVLRLNDGTLYNIARKSYDLVKKVEVDNPNFIHSIGVNKFNPDKVVIDTVIASVKQFPVKLGYAITIHKSQGQTFDAVVVDLSQCFIPGLGYVALSRVKNIDNLVITNFDDRALKVDTEALSYVKDVKRGALKSRREFNDNMDYYDELLNNRLSLNVMWDVEESGVYRRNRDKKK